MGFNPCFNGRGVKTLIHLSVTLMFFCFNPCFNGRGVKTQSQTILWTEYHSFNPCFNGRGVKTYYRDFDSNFLFSVSILVLMEEALRQSLRHCGSGAFC